MNGLSLDLFKNKFGLLENIFESTRAPFSMKYRSSAVISVRPSAGRAGKPGNWMTDPNAANLRLYVAVVGVNTRFTPTVERCMKGRTKVGAMVGANLVFAPALLHFAKYSLKLAAFMTDPGKWTEGFEK
jgi:hypothetical protein